MNRIAAQAAPVLRRLLSRPAFALAVIAILAVGIGANTATLDLLYGYLLAPLPYPRAARLVNVYFISKQVPGNLRMSYRTYFDLRAHTTGMSDAGMFKLESLNLASGVQLAHVRGAAVSASLFSTLGVRPALGRVLAAGANRPAAVPEVVLSERLRARLFARNQPVLGQTIRLNGRAYTVVGVMPRSFNFPDSHTALWLPKVFSPFDYAPDNVTAWHDTMIARLAPGVSAAQLAMRAQAALAREIAHFPQPAALPQLRAMGLRIAVKPLRAALLGSLGERLLLAQMATALLLLLVWFNLANLFIARALERRGELIVRRVLGADTWTVFGQLFTDSLMLSLAGSLAGLALGEVLLRALLRMGLASSAVTFPLRAWGVAALIALALAALSALVFSLAGLHFIRRQDLAQALRDTDARGTGARGEHRLRATLVVVQLALAFVLGGIGAILLHSLIGLDQTRLGFQPEHIVTFQIQLPQGNGPAWKAKLRSQLARMRASLAGVPGAQAATIASDVPFDGRGMDYTAYPLPFDGTHTASLFPIVTDAGYFNALGIHLLRGRLFAARDAASSADEAVIDARAARELFGTTDVVGRRFNFDEPNDSRPNVAFRIIGVVANTREAHLGAGEPQGVLYLDRGQVLQAKQTAWSWVYPSWYAAVRTPLAGGAILPAVTRAVSAGLPRVPIYDVRSMEQRLSHRLARRRAVALLVLIFACGALSVAAVGLYSVQSYSVSRRLAEFALRAALGADHTRLRRLVLREVATLVLIGSVLGLCGIVVTGRLLLAAFYGLRPADPLSLLVVVMVLGLTTALAGWLPARRASRAPPVDALRAR